MIQQQGDDPPPPQQPAYGQPGSGSPIEPMSEVDNTIGKQPPRVTRSPPCSAEGFFPIENDCSHFYRCVSSGRGFSKYEFSCGEGTVWDPDNNACNHAWAVQRSDCKSTAVNGDSGNNQGDGSPQQEISYPDITEISKPYQTTENTDSTQSPEGIESTNENNQPNNGNNPNQNPYNNTASHGGQCPSEGFHPVEGDCRKFTRCVNNGGGFSQYEFECAEGTVWDNDAVTCNYPYAVQNTNCRSVTGEQTATTAGGSEITGNEMGFSSNQQTTSGQQSSTTNNNQQTSVDQLTSSAYGQQTTSSGYEQQTSSTSNQQTSFTSSQQTSSTSEQQSSISSQQTSSTSGQQTSSTSSQQMSTSNQQSSSTSGQQTSITSGQQTSSSSGQQTSTTSGQQTSSTSAQQTSTTSGQQTSSSSGQQTSTSGQQTSSTSGQQTSSTTTGDGQTSSSQTGVENNVNSTNTNNHNVNQSKIDQCTSEGFFPSSSNCNKFYRCVKNEVKGYSKYEFSCGPGTVWDPDNNVCNHPWAVQNEKCRSGSEGYSTPQVMNGTDLTPTGTHTTESYNSTTLATNTTKEPPCSESTTIPDKNTSSKPSSESQTTTQPTSLPPTTKTPSQSTTTRNPSNSYTSTPKEPQNITAATELTTLASSTESSDNTTPVEIARPTSGVVTDHAETTTVASTTISSNTYDNTTLDNTTLTGTEYTTSTTMNQNPTKPSNKITCNKAGFYPHPENCKKFYRCVDWDGDKGERFSIYYFDCPAGTIFDPNLNTCNHEESVYPPRQCNNKDSSQTTESTTNLLTNGTMPEVTTVGGNSTTIPAESTTNSTESYTEQTTTTFPEGSTNGTTSGSVDYTIGSGETTPLNTQSVTNQPTTTVNAESSTGISSSIVTTPSVTNPVESTITSSSQMTTTAYPITTDITTISSVASNEKCPDLGPDQFTLVCPTGFRRHPKYCNLFYQCTTSQSNEIKILTLSCTNGTIYDDKKIQCLPPGMLK